VNGVGFGLLRSYHGANVLDEIDSALFASAANALAVPARGALETHRIVATLAEARHAAHT
jgi:hypothetical protein